MMAIAILALTGGLQTMQAETPRAEYPRPQFERSEWKNLNGTWSYSFDFGRCGAQKGWVESKGFDGKITIPFCPESELSGVKYTEFINAIWYQRTLDIPAAWEGKRILLHFGAVDYKTEVYVDGKKTFTHYGSGSSFEVDITKYVTAGKSSNLVLYVEDDVRSGKQPCGKQSTQLNSYGCCYTRVTGIWQTVWMEPVDPAAIQRVFATPDVDQQQLVVRPEFYEEKAGYTFTATVTDGKKKVAEKTVSASNGSIVVLPIKNPKLWSPEEPNLYDVVYTVKDKTGKVMDEVKSYAGMRKIHVADGYFYLNNQPYYQRLVLDQGFYPQGIWTAPSDEALKQDIEMSKAVGFNGARLHQKVFEERYYYWADHLGYICWGEQGNWGLDTNDEIAARNFLSEWNEILLRDRNHPCIVTWTPTNETWEAREGQYERFLTDLYNMTHAVDPTRPVNDASGDCHIKTDIWTVHDYSRDPAALIKNHGFEKGQIPPYRNISDRKFLADYGGQPYMVDEFGGLPWIKESERSSSWGYGGNIDDMEEFYNILEKEVDALKACPNVVGYCYTQITDVEQEKNGIYYYDRTKKFDTERLKSIFAKIPSIIEIPETNKK